MGRTKQLSDSAAARAKRRTGRDAEKKPSPPSTAAPKRVKATAKAAGKPPSRATTTPANAHVVVRPSIQPSKNAKTQQPLHHAARVVVISGQVVRAADVGSSSKKKKKKKRRRRKASVEMKEQDDSKSVAAASNALAPPLNGENTSKQEPEAAKKSVVVTPLTRNPPTRRRSLHALMTTDAPPVVTRTLRSNVQQLTLTGRPPRAPKRAAITVPMMSPLPQVTPPRVIKLNDEDEEDATLIQMQKRLFKNTKRRIIPESPTPEKTAVERVATRSSSVMQRAAEAKVANLKQQDSPPRRRTLMSSVTLSNWCLSWPLPCNSETLELELAFEGKVGGKRHVKRFEVERRVNCAQFVSTTHKTVKLEGCLDVEKAEEAGIPPTVIQLMLEGIPAHWRRKMEDCMSIDKRRKSADRKRKRTESSAQQGKPEGRVKRLKISQEVTPVIDWWHGDQPSSSKPIKTKQQKIVLVSNQVDKLNDVAEKTTIWTDGQLQSLMSAKLKVKTTVPNFWAEVAMLVPGKSADDCRAKSFETFASPSGRKPTKRPVETQSKTAVVQVPTKIHRAGSNLFKKQVREFIEQQEKKHVDDLFAQVTPSKADLGELAGLDDLSSPAVAGTFMNSDSDDDERDVTPGRERLEKVSTSKRDEVDSYVLNLKRSRIGQDMTKPKPPKSSAAALRTPRPKKQAANKKKSMYLVEECGSHFLEASVSPGGTTHVRIEKDGSSSESELDYRSSDEEDDLF